jgi:hypothetical protein
MEGYKTDVGLRGEGGRKGVVKKGVVKKGALPKGAGPKKGENSRVLRLKTSGKCW